MGNSSRPTSKPSCLIRATASVRTAAGRVGLCDAVGIALEIFKRPITNTLMLGAFAKTTGVVSLEALKRSLEDSDFRDAGLAQNLLALERGYNETTVYSIDRRAAA